MIASFRQDGTVMDLAAPEQGDIDLGRVANALSKINRFNGRYSAPGYSVAQHSVMGADALFAETGDHVLAGFFLVHDCHEAFLDDWTRPVLDLLRHDFAALYAKTFPRRGDGPRVAALIGEARKAAQNRFDVLIWRAACLPNLDRLPAHRSQVAAMDLRMLRAEALALFGPAAAARLAERAPPKLAGTLKPWGAMKAEEAFADRLKRYLGIVVTGLRSE